MGDELGGAPRSWREVRAFLRVEEPLNDEWQGRATIRVFRVGQWLVRQEGGAWALPRKVWWLVYKLWVQMLLGADLPPMLEAGAGLRLAHAGRGSVLHHRVVIGARCTLYHRVTLGMRGVWEVPVVGDDVTLGAGCVVVGPVTVGDGAAIGPNAVVTDDVPAGGRLVAAPSRLLEGRRTPPRQRRTSSGSTLPRRP